MKIFHTADWHLGKLIHGFYMTDDQRYVLDQLIEAIRTEAPDLLIIAGDIYDRAIPPSDAIDLLDEVLTTIIIDLGVPVIAISGNHDSPARLNFAHQFLSEQGFHIVGESSFPIEPILLSDENGPIHFYPIPYLEPSTARQLLQDDSIRSHDDAMKKSIESIEKNLNPNARNIAIAHAFIIHSSQDLTTSDSERPLAIGGSEFIQADHFEPFDYTALGHLHQAQIVKDERIQYSGSILKYSLSEQHHNKGFTVIEIDGKGKITSEKRPLNPRRDLRQVEGTLDEILQMPISEDYLFVTLLDETPVLQPMEQIRTVFPNAMHVERKIRRIHTQAEINQRLKDIREEDDETLFKGFYQLFEENPPDAETLELFQSSLNKLLDR